MLSGYLPNPFNLTVTHEGAHFSKEIEPFGQPNASLSDDVRRKEVAAVVRQESATYLKELFDSGAVSGYGDVRLQTNQINSEVRDAREIPTGHFTVSQSLYDDIERIWSEHFLPGSVHIEPYKIHLYGPGGCFKPHRDTPEKDLVGTFLVGIGDCTTNNTGNLRVGVKKGMRAYPGSFVAFYPDIEHEVLKVEGGYRGVIAFKVFKKPSSSANPASGPKPQTEFEKGILKKIQRALSKLQPPYGILLEHCYSIETSELSGMDNLLHTAASSLLASSAEVHFIPVLLRFKSEVPEDWEPGSNEPLPAKAPVFPLTQVHIDALLAETASDYRDPICLLRREKELNQSMPGLDSGLYFRSHRDDDESDDSSSSRTEPMKQSTKHRLRVDVSDTPYAWLRLCKNVPFYSLQKTADKITWSATFEEGEPDYYGNESRPNSADSIYLSYAMIVISNKKRQRDDEP